MFQVQMYGMCFVALLWSNNVKMFVSSKWKLTRYCGKYIYTIKALVVERIIVVSCSNSTEFIGPFQSDHNQCCF